MQQGRCSSKSLTPQVDLHKLPSIVIVIIFAIVLANVIFEVPLCPIKSLTPQVDLHKLASIAIIVIAIVIVNAIIECSLVSDLIPDLKFCQK